MTYIAFNPDRFIGKSLGSGQCVAFVEEAAITPRTRKWRKGKKIAGNPILKGTAIATFQAGMYSNSVDGLSHAAIYLRQTKEGIYVLDQWSHLGHRQPVHERLIHFRDTKWHGKPVDDANNYYAIN